MVKYAYFSKKKSDQLIRYFPNKLKYPSRKFDTCVFQSENLRAACVDQRPSRQTRAVLQLFDKSHRRKNASESHSHVQLAGRSFARSRSHPLNQIVSHGDSRSGKSRLRYYYK